MAEKTLTRGDKYKYEVWRLEQSVSYCISRHTTAELAEQAMRRAQRRSDAAFARVGMVDHYGHEIRPVVEEG